MKKYVHALNLLVFLCLICCKDDDNGFIAPIAHNFKITYGKEYKEKPVAKAQMILTNNEDGKTYKAFTDAKGIAKIEVIPGTYKASVSRTLTPEEYLVLSGQKTAGNITFNGSVENLKINTDTETETTIEIVTGRIGNLVLSQIYYAGSDVRLGADYRDQFFEVHNNANETIYLDGLYIAQLAGTEEDDFNYYYLPSGRIDWSQSIGQKDLEKANTDYFYSGDIIQFPGSGEDYPLPSGKSIIIASTALNHKNPLTVRDSEGESKTYSVPEPERTIDLSNAQFETYYRKYSQQVGRETISDTDIDNPKVPNMNIVLRSWSPSYGDDLNLNPESSLILFSAKEKDFKQLNEVLLPYSQSYMEYLLKDIPIKQIPKNLVIDGVELQNMEKTKPKQLTDDVDAGETSVSKGDWSSQVVIRKVSSQIDGKTFYQDTNNSTNDFKVLNHPQVDIE